MEGKLQCHSRLMSSTWYCSLPSISYCWQSFSSAISHFLSLLQSTILLACSLDASPFVPAAILYYCTFQGTVKLCLCYFLKCIICVKSIINLSSTVSQVPQVMPWVKNSSANARNTGSVPGVGNGNPLQCSCLEISMNRGAGGLQSMGPQRVKHGWAHTNTEPSVEPIVLVGYRG